MYYANILASMGEVTVLVVDETLENQESIVSNMIFVPKDESILTENQKEKLNRIVHQLKDGIFVLAFCNGDPNKIDYIESKEEIFRYFEHINQKEKYY